MAPKINPPAQDAPADKAAAANGKAAPLPPVPFVRGALPKIQRAKQWSHNVTLTTEPQPLPTLEVPPHGFARSVVIRLGLNQRTGGTYSADGLAAALSSVNFADTQGSDVIVPINGHDLKMVNKWNPSGGFSDPAILHPDPLSMYLRLPLEISERDALGSLPNMDSASQYTVDATVGTLADVFATDTPDVAPTLSVKAYLEAWSSPQPQDFGGRPVSPQPPALNTTQYISKHRWNVPASGDHNFSLQRRGNLIRSLILIARDEDGNRSDACLPESFRFRWDGRELFDLDTDFQRYLMRERGGMTVDTGVLLLDFTHEFDGRLGAELRDSWLRTMKSSDLEVDLNGVTTAGQISVITVDVAPAGNVFVD